MNCAACIVRVAITISSDFSDQEVTVKRINLTNLAI